MKESTLIFINIVICFFVLLPMGHSQKKVKGKPISFDRPLDYFNNPEDYRAYILNTSPKSKDNAWLVFSDRNDNPVYNKPGGSVVKKINFRDFFFVVDERDEWIKIATARVNGLKIQKKSKQDFGWIRKDRMLLWNSSVSGKVTKIHKKVLLLNRADQIDKILLKPEKELIKIYSNPEKTQEETTRRIFEYFFLLKEENNMLLISEDANVDAYSPEKIIGWVSIRDCDIWDTRICLEPNFYPGAVRERSNDKKLIIRAYDNLINAQKSVSGSSKESGVFWRNDPVNLSKDEKASSNPNRFLGSVIRFPMVSISGGPGNEVYQSGIVGTIKLKSKGGSVIREVDESRLAKLERRLKALESKASKVNIFFVIEGTDYTSPFKETIVKSIKAVNRDLANKNLQKVNYGALIYRDILEENVVISGKTVDRTIEFTPLHPDIDKLTNFIQNAEFDNKVDREENTAMFYGLNKALSKAGFKANKDEQSELNIIVLIGAYGDFRADKDRQRMHSSHPAFFNSDKLGKLVDNLYEIDAHLYAVQVLNDGYRIADRYTKGARYIMLENAKMLHNKQQEKINSKIRKDLMAAGYQISGGPNLELDDANEVTYIEDGAIPGQITRPLSNTLSNYSINTYIRENINNSIDHAVKLKMAFIELINKGNGGDLSELKKEIDIEKNPRTAGAFEQALINELVNALEDNPDLDIPDMMDEKYKLFTEAYIPYKYAEASYPLVSYVLFMPERDLIDYLYNIERNFSKIAGETSYDKKREGLVKIYQSLVDQFTGEGKKLTKREEDITIADVQRIINGIYSSGLKLEHGKEIPIKDLLSERMVSNEKIDELIRRFKTVVKTLDGIIRDGESHDFCFKTDEYNRYYWIPIEETF